MSDAKKVRILTEARALLLRYGYRRVNMGDIAEAAGMSRPALYLLFRNKEEIFLGVAHQWAEETIRKIEAEMATVTSPHEKLERAFEIWAVQPFELVQTVPDAHELVECTLGFARPAQQESDARFEATIVPVLTRMIEDGMVLTALPPERIAHVLAHAAHGFKLAAETPDELRRMIADLVTMSLGTPPGH